MGVWNKLRDLAQLTIGVTVLLLIVALAWLLHFWEIATARRLAKRRLRRSR